MDNCEGQARKESVIDIIITQIEKTSEQLHTTVCRTEPLLANVLSPPSPTTEEAKGAHSGNSPLETRLIAINQSIGNVNGILTDVLSRVQL